MKKTNLEQIDSSIKPIILKELPNNPLVSILMPNFNYEKYVPQSIESVLKQDYKNYELIICDDGSTDNSISITKKYTESDPRLKLISKINEGVCKTLNRAFIESNGDIICLLDSDDYWIKNKLTKIINYYKNNLTTGFVAHPLTSIKDNGQILRDKNPLASNHGWLLPSLLSGYTPIIPSASGLSLRREIAEIIFPLPYIKKEADTIIHQRAIVLTMIGIIDEVLGYYRIHGQNISGALDYNDLNKIEKEINLANDLLIERKKFIFDKTGIDINNLKDYRLNELILSKNLIIGKKIKRKEINQYIDGNRAIFWILLFNLPKKIALRLLTFIKSETSFKRFLRRVLPKLTLDSTFLINFKKNNNL